MGVIPRLAPHVRTLGWATLVANAVLVVTGGAVRLTGSGLGCPTWPRCTDASFVPHAELGIHGAIEFGNRMVTILLAVIALATVLLAWRAGRRPVATIALLTGIHHFGRLDAAATVEWCRRALAATTPRTALHATAQTYLLHGLGYAGRVAESFATAVAAAGEPGEPDRLDPLRARLLERALRLIRREASSHDAVTGSRTCEG